MSISGKFIFWTSCVAYFTLCIGEATFPQDTYINALQSSHQTDTDNTGGGYHYSPPPNNNYLSPPTPVYGPPAPVYGPPPIFYKPAPIPYHHPRENWFLDKLKNKINLFTIGKIILKLLIFKKIIKFIGVICLLLFLPKLKNMFKEDTSVEEDGLESKQVKTDRDVLEKRVEELFGFVLKALTSYQENST